MGLSRFSLEGRVAIVTGAGGIRGMGRATALAFADAGANVTVCDINIKGETFDLEGTAEEIQKIGRRALAIQADVNNESNVANLVKKTVQEFGTIDILANVAGQSAHMKFMDVTRDFWNKAMDVNLRTALICSQVVGKVMMEQRRGSIINWSSLAGVKIGSASPYGIAKAGLIALTAWAANQLAPYDIRVNAIVPGGVSTDLDSHKIGVSPWAAMPGDQVVAPPPRPQQSQQQSGQPQRNPMYPLGRVAQPDDIADVALFLASDASRYITGQVIIVDGGLMLK